LILFDMCCGDQVGSTMSFVTAQSHHCPSGCLQCSAHQAMNRSHTTCHSLARLTWPRLPRMQWMNLATGVLTAYAITSLKTTRWENWPVPPIW